MKRNKISFKILAAVIAVAGFASCQKMDKPALGDYQKDNLVTPTTALRFFVSFDSTSAEDQQINKRFKDSVSGYPSFFPDASLKYGPGVHGTAYIGNGNKSLSYVNANDFMKSTSFTVAFWEKHNGVTGGDAEFVMSVPSTQGHWSNSAMLLIVDNKGAGTTLDSAVIKLMVAEVGNGDHWFELTGNNRMPNILDNQWHHLAFAYDETTSNMSVYRDGVLYKVLSWAGHGPIKFDYTKVSGFYLGGKTTDWGKPFNGGLDQFRLYNKALSAAEVANLYNSKL
ncbi:LamG domain-containing protein [Flavisolibacter nicotianae]|uniref:LamG domain-containing protein n=1 Tax=Flavisolibacter nicotianae TaxID=2364882 RepID=UPI000EB208D7|nr:LamG domain-containing protein [Flavisolibacter nicotianae]